RASFRVGGFVLSAVVALVFALLFFCMPMSIGFWWYVYPREITVAALCALAAMPSLPKNPWLSAPGLCALLFAITMPVRFIVKQYALFDTATLDFQHVIEGIPKAPKLAYMIWDHSGTESMQKPFLHLPAWVQA